MNNQTDGQNMQQNAPPVEAIVVKSPKSVKADPNKKVRKLPSFIKVADPNIANDPVPKKRRSRKSSKKSRRVNLVKPRLAWVYKVAKIANLPFRVAENAAKAIREICYTVAEKIVIEAVRISMSQGKKTVQSQDIASALNLVVPSELAAKYANLARYPISKVAQNKATTGVFNVRTDITTLVFGCGQSKNLVKAKTGMKVSSNALIMLAAIQQFICEDFVEQGIIVAEAKKIKTLKVHCIEQAAMNDQNLHALFKMT